MVSNISAQYQYIQYPGNVEIINDLLQKALQGQVHAQPEVEQTIQLIQDKRDQAQYRAAWVMSCWYEFGLANNASTPESASSSYFSH